MVFLLVYLLQSVDYETMTYVEDENISLSRSAAHCHYPGFRVNNWQSEPSIKLVRANLAQAL